MHDSVGVAISCTLKDLVSETLDFLGREGASDVSHVLLEVELAVLEDQVQLVLRIQHLLQPTTITLYDGVLTLRCWGA